MRTSFAAIVAAFVAFAAVPAAAQAVGPLTWQTEPFCNVLTLTLVPQGGVYQVVGTDNLCGTGVATVTGTAAPGGAGVILGLTIAYPNGRAAHVSASVSLATASGTWSDADANSGTFAFNGASGGAPRPSPVGATSITTNQFSSSVYAGSGTAATVARSDHIHDDRYFTEAETTALVNSRARPAQVVNIAQALCCQYSLTPQSQEYFYQVTTTVAGRLDLRMPFRGNAVCSSSGSLGFLFFVVDGIGVRSSFTGITPGLAVSTTVVGVTDTVVAAGTHVVSIGINCGANSGGFTGVGTMTPLSVVVIP